MIIKLLNADAVYCDRRLGTTIQLYISDVDNTQSVSVVIDEKRYAAKGSDNSHYEVNLYDMRRAKKDEIGLTKKLIGIDSQEFYCLDCLADYLEVTAEELIAKIEEFKEEGCTLFK